MNPIKRNVTENRQGCNTMIHRKAAAGKGGTLYNLYILTGRDLTDEELRVFIGNKRRLLDEGPENIHYRTKAFPDCFGQI